ncbi:MAG: DoxX family protein [Bradymonadia bacterium]
MSRLAFTYPFKYQEHLMLLMMRCIGGGLMLHLHGWSKWENYASKAPKFPDPLGIGSENSLALTVFAEVICSTTLVLGLFTRWSAFVCMFTMGVAAFIVHQDDPVKVQEKALLYFAIYGALTTFGPGAFSVDALRQSKTG